MTVHTMYEAPGGGPTAFLRGECGTPYAPPNNRWATPADNTERALVELVAAPVLDVGCGPGRHVVALAERGVPALGIDVCERALDLARGQGASVLHRSVFDRVPAAGRWGSALLLDGNIGIGADPARLMSRVASLLRPRGRLLVELDPPGTSPEVRRVRLEIVGGRGSETVEVGPWFDWGRLPADHAAACAARASLDVVKIWNDDGRHLALLLAPARPGPGPDIGTGTTQQPHDRP